jgi:hypothetical protein
MIQVAPVPPSARRQQMAAELDPIEVPNSLLEDLDSMPEVTPSLRALFEDPPTEAIDLPIGEHGAYGSTGAAWVREQRRRKGVEKGLTNPFKKQLQHAEKQLRQQQRRGAVMSIVVAAQLKVENITERKELWDAQQRGHQYIENIIISALFGLCLTRKLFVWRSGCACLVNYLFGGRAVPDS